MLRLFKLKLMSQCFLNCYLKRKICQKRWNFLYDDNDFFESNIDLKEKQFISKMTRNLTKNTWKLLVETKKQTTAREKSLIA